MGMLREKIKGFAETLSTKTLSSSELDEVLWQFQLILLENDVTLEVAEKICEKVKKKLLGEQLGLLQDKKAVIWEALINSIKEVVSQNNVDLIKLVGEKRKLGEPFVIIFVGINGTGKTTTIAKVAKYFTRLGYSVLIAASDTFRAGAIEQLEQHARRVDVKVIKHQPGADAAAVAYDAKQHARAKKINVVLVDTAGRMQTNKNLMDELRKIFRVVKPDMSIFVGDALTGNDAVEQAKTFDEMVGIDAVILAKADADAKGGAALSIPFVTGKPIIFLGVGQGYDDLVEFSPEWFIEKLSG